jgi:putative membrane protein
MSAIFSLNPYPSLCCWLGASLCALVYVAGLTKLWRKAGVGHGAGKVQVFVFSAGWLIAILPALTGLHVLGRQVFVLHMIEHELLMVVSAPLLILSRPAPILLWGLPNRLRSGIGRALHTAPVRGTWHVLTQPATATALHLIALWAWHWPPLFQMALQSEAAHTAQHVSFLVTALLFWWTVLSVPAARKGPAPATMALFVTTLHTSLLGALLTFSHGYWYSTAPYLASFCGLSRIEDQQLAGLVMWIPAGLAYITAALFVLRSALQEPEPSGVEGISGRAIERQGA